MLFLSFTNLTSVGLSDITPVLAQARSWVMIEQVAGLMYVALVISRVVGLTDRPAARLTDPNEDPPVARRVCSYSECGSEDDPPEPGVRQRRAGRR